MRINTSELTHPTIAHALKDNAQSQPAETALEIVSGTGTRSTITYHELYVQAAKVADYLFAHTAQGDRVLLPTNNEMAFYSAFLGCMLSKRIAVPIQVPRPRPNLPDLGLGRFASVMRDGDIKLVLIDENFILLLEKNKEHTHQYLNGANLISVQSILREKAIESTEDRELPSPDDIAFLQYTSGSTAAPKGVILTHKCIVANQRSMVECYQFSSNSTFVSWLPLFHDMGLSCGLFMPIFLGKKAIIFSPLSFIAKPEIWLKEIVNHSDVVSGGPNFSYTHCVNRISDDIIKSLDLSQWKVMFCGAEPINPSAIDVFFEKFKATGITEEAFFPSYGLAEATLFVSAKSAGENPLVTEFDGVLLGKNLAKIPSENGSSKSTRLMSCGRPDRDIDVKIVDPETLTPLPEGSIGEIAVNSQSMGIGYWKNEKESEKTFNKIILSGSELKYFLTGDYGFLFEGELYISGRRKEVIIVNGVNHYPQDIELTAQQQHEAFERHKAAAFTVGENQNLILALEARENKLPENTEDLEVAIKQSIRAAHQIIVDEITISNPGTIPRTSSGKVQRINCAKLYSEGFFKENGSRKALS
ncbi:MAG: fatty acyl-AMP ligase [Pseudomonadales bacterium]|nr:fatty acyl-AMP ligase [Pseudomonadales bacterium]